MEFHGVKVALFSDNKLLVYLRDNKPGLFNANMWDFPGGGREGDESAIDCAIREIKEEFGITLSPESFVWEKAFPAQKDPSQKSMFMVGNISQKDVDSIVLGEGQKWELIDQKDFLERADVIEALKVRFKDYLASR